MWKLLAVKILYAGQVLSPNDFYECSLFIAEHGKKHFIPSCSYVKTFQRKGFTGICEVFLDCGQVLFCYVGSSKQSISSVFWHLLQIGHKSWRCCSHFVCPIKKPTSLWVCSTFGRGEWSAGASQWVLYTEESLSEEKDGKIVGSCAKSTGWIKPAKDKMRAHSTQQLQHSRTYTCSVSRA